MKFITPKIHSYIDYLMSALLLFFPWIFGKELQGPDAWIPFVAGITILTFTILTRFRHEHFGIIPIRTHLIGDIIIGLAIAASPWYSVFTQMSGTLHIVVGLAIVVVAILTDSDPSSGRIKVEPGQRQKLHE